MYWISLTGTASAVVPISVYAMIMIYLSIEIRMKAEFGCEYIHSPLKKDFIIKSAGKASYAFVSFLYTEKL